MNNKHIKTPALSKGKNNIGILAIGLSAAISIYALPAIADSDMVKGYLRSTSGEVWKNNFGECWRSRFAETSERLETCGYAPPPEPVKEMIPESVKEMKPVPVVPKVKVAEKVFEQLSINDSLLFGFDSAVLSSQAKTIIDGHLEKYQGKDQLTEKISVIGHTDSTGSEVYNQKLSERRAASVASYLEQHSYVLHSQIEVSGKGESEPVATNSTRDGRAKNRRIDITFEGKIEK